MTKITAIILAAGTSSRYGQENKLLLPFGQSVVVRETVQAVLKAGVLNPIVVTGHQCERVEAALHDLPVLRVHNPNYRAGEMLSSIQTGLRHILAQSDQHIEAVFIVLGDQPLLPPQLLRRLSQAFGRQCAEILAPRFDGVRGHPVLMARKWWAEALALQPGQNLRELLKAHPEAVAFLQVNSDIVLRDVDTPQAYAEALALLQP